LTIASSVGVAAPPHAAKTIDAISAANTGRTFIIFIVDLPESGCMNYAL
jgi:hypothetical protein